jgi:predicted TIM-barrel fold metal-dependent hydrolase
MLPLYPGQEHSYSSRYLDPLWREAADLEMPVNLHTATSREKSKDFRAVTPTDIILDTVQIQRVLLDMILSGLFDRIPGLKIVSAENDVGWAGSMLQRADVWFQRNRQIMRDATTICTRPPSEYFHENVKVTFMEDRAGILAREIIGPDVLMWGSDFPHHASTWPDSICVLDDQFAGQSAEDRLRITRDNAKQLYKF